MPALRKVNQAPRVESVDVAIVVASETIHLHNVTEELALVFIHLQTEPKLKLSLDAIIGERRRFPPFPFDTSSCQVSG